MKYIMIFLTSVLISSLSQVILKSSANKKHDNLLKEYLNPKVIIAYGMFFLSTLITIIAYRVVPLSMGGILEASGYIFVAVLSYVFLHERISKKKTIGLTLILLGIVVFNFHI